MEIEPPQLYKKYYSGRDFERLGLFQILVEKYQIKNALYPGSFVHITPSFVFPDVTYLDCYKKTQTFFDSNISDFIESRKQYPDPSNFKFIQANYTQKIDIPLESIDLLISQYAGIISYHCKQYLKPNGILVANNSHGDASMAYLDSDYEFIGVINNRGEKYSFSEKDLNKYFIPKSRKQVTKEELLKTTKGIGYTKSAGNYVFKKRTRA